MDVKPGFHYDISTIKHKHNSERGVHSTSISEDAHNTSKSVKKSRTKNFVLLVLGLMVMSSENLLL